MGSEFGGEWKHEYVYVYVWLCPCPFAVHLKIVNRLSYNLYVATHSSILAWKIPWTEEPARLQSVGLQRVRHD